MHEIGLWIVTDAADAKGLGHFAQVAHVDAGDAKIDRLAAHVVTVLGDAGRGVTQHRVRFGRAIARDHLDLALAENGLQVIQHRQQARVHLMRHIGMVVAQKMVQRL